MRYLVLLIFVFIVIRPSFAQKNGKEIGVGAAVIYNFQTEGLGAELRGDFHLTRHWAVVPEVSYFPSFNDIHELYAGASVHYLIPINRNIDIYPTAGGFYNHWFNAVEYSHGLKKVSNVTAEVGGGLVRSRGCIRPFIEGRYDVKWKESNVRIGILWFFNSCKQPDCPAFK